MDKLIVELSAPWPELQKGELREIFEDAYLARPSPPIVRFSDIPRTMTYTGQNKCFKTQLHIGQRKLFLTELQLFVEKVPSYEKVICVYAGAAPSQHTGYLAQLFPNIRFLLVDPNPFDVREANPLFLTTRGDDAIDDSRAMELVGKMGVADAQICIINSYFTIPIAAAVGKLFPNCVFISDIRTNSVSNEDPLDIDIIWNMSQMYNWVMSMRPRCAMLKFRHPYHEMSCDKFREYAARDPFATDFALSKLRGIDFVADYCVDKMRFFDGDLNIQAWAGVSSTESRLVINNFEVIEWGGFADYENRYFYFNNVDRTFVLHENDNACCELGFDMCNDCSLENYLWKQYINKYGRGGKVPDYVRKLCDVTRRPLKREGHGRMFARHNIATITNEVKKFNDAKG